MMPNAKTPAWVSPPPEKMVSKAVIPPAGFVASCFGDVDTEADDDDEGEGEKDAIPQFGDFPGVRKGGDHGVTGKL